MPDMLGHVFDMCGDMRNMRMYLLGNLHGNMYRTDMLENM
jgi:hypothetical protein